MEETYSTDKKYRKELNGGIASLVLLSILNSAADSMYGYQIASLIEDITHDSPVIKQGTLYPVLHSLESQGLLVSEVEPSVSGPPRRYYRITRPGREALVRWKEMWDRARNFVDTVLTGVDYDKHC